MSEIITVTGTVEEIIYSNPDNGYSVVGIDSVEEGQFTATGYMPFITEGESVALSGNWTTHPDYGEQFKAEYYETVIIPAYNEEENIVRVVDNLINNYGQLDYVVINDGSRDNTAKLCREHGYNLVDLPVNLGLAGAFQAGMKYALANDYDYAIQFDGDGQHNPQFIEGMEQMAEKDNLDIVIGSRFASEKKPFTARMLGSRLIEFCILVTCHKRIKDPTSGMRMFNRRMIHKLATSMNFGPEPDTVAYLTRCGAKVGEYQVEMNDRIAGESYLNPINSMKYMFNMTTSILFVQWFRKRGL